MLSNVISILKFVFISDISKAEMTVLLYFIFAETILREEAYPGSQKWLLEKSKMLLTVFCLFESTYIQQFPVKL